MNKKTKILIIFCLFLLLILTPWDYSITLFLFKHKMNFANFMKQSIFNNGPLGASDFGEILFVMIFLFYLLIEFNIIKVNVFLRIKVGFLMFSSLFITVFLIHGIKYLMGRPRPFLIFDHSYNFVPWYWFGSEVNGSFPSGHTAAVAIFLGFSYFLPRKKTGVKILYEFFIILLAIIMFIARCMTEDHWITDGVASIFFVYIGFDLCYFNLLKTEFFLKNPSVFLKNNNRFWELKLFFKMLLMLGAVILLIFLIRNL